MKAGGNLEVQFRIQLPGNFGKLLVSHRDGKLTGIRIVGKGEGIREREGMTIPMATRDKRLEERLQADFRTYFSGKKVTFSYALDDEKFTPFERAVWAAMREIPYGETRSYRWLAEKVGKPRASRAVGNACGKNPFLIVQPCHRVVGSGGTLGGFSSGLALKKALLRLEGIEFYHGRVNKKGLCQVNTKRRRLRRPANQ